MEMIINAIVVTLSLLHNCFMEVVVDGGAIVALMAGKFLLSESLFNSCFRIASSDMVASN